MSRSQDERQPVREGVLKSNRSMNPVLSVANMEKEKHDSQLAAKISSGSEHSGYRAVDLIKPSKSLSNSMSHVSVGSAPLPPMPPLQAPSLTSILPGPGHPIMPPVLSRGSLVRGGALPAQIPLMGQAAAAIAPPRAGIAVPSLRPTSMPPPKSASNANQVPVPSKGSSIFSPIVSSNRVLSSSSASVINRTSDHTKVMDAKITYIQTGVHYSKPSSSSSLPMSGTATVQVIASGTAAHTHIAPLQSNKSFSVVPSPNVLKIGSPNAQNSQSLSGSNSSTAVTTYRVPPPPNSITFSKVIPQPILIPSTTSGTPSTTKPESQDHPRNNSTLTSSIGHVSSTVSTSPHAMAFSSHLHYSPGLSVHGTSSQPHLSYPSNAAENKTDKLKPGNPSLQYTISSFFPIEPNFPPPVGVHRFASNSQFHSYVRTPSGHSSGYSSFPMFVDGGHGFPATPLPIPGMSSASRDSHHHSTSGESPPVMNTSYSIHNFPNLQSSAFHPTPQQSNNNSSPRPGPGILRKRTAEGYPAHSFDRMSSPTKQETRTEHRQDFRSEHRHTSGPNSLSRQESPRLICDEKSTYNDSSPAVGEPPLSSISNSVPATANPNIKREPTTPPQPSGTNHKTVANQNLPLTSQQSPGSAAEASPRKKPRKQNVITTEDKFSSKVSIEEEEAESGNKMKQKRKESKVENQIIRIQKPTPKGKSEESGNEAKEEEIVEPDELSKYYMFISRRKTSALGDYKINAKAAHHHFYRYSDVKSKDERKPLDLTNTKRIHQNVSGWRIFHMSSQMDDLCSIESEVCNKLYEFQRELPRPSKQYMLTAMCHDLQNGKRFASIDEQLRVLHELIQGNIQRCQLSMEQLLEAKQTMLRVIDHKPKILEIVKKHKHKRSSKKKTLPSY